MDWRSRLQLDQCMRRVGPCAFARAAASAAACVALFAGFWIDFFKGEELVQHPSADISAGDCYHAEGCYFLSIKMHHVALP